MTPDASAGALVGTPPTAQTGVGGGLRTGGGSVLAGGNSALVGGGSVLADGGTVLAGGDAWGVATAVADAVLYEGYLLYPYRASSAKNQVRWQFGVLVPPDAALATGETSQTRTECLCEPAADATLRIRLRFLHLRVRTVERHEPDRDSSLSPVPTGAGDSGFISTDRLVVGDVEHVGWDETVERVIDVAVPVSALLAGEVAVPFDVPASVEVEPLPADGSAGRLVRRCEALRGEIRLVGAALQGPYGGLHLRVDIHNQTPGIQHQTPGIQHQTPVIQAEGGGGRQVALRRAFIGAHTLLGLSDGSFLSLTDPPRWAAEASAACVNEGAWPVLVGDAEHPATMLSAPIILGDFPAIAPESPGPLFDGTEIDEILTLRTLTLTEDEKREARSTDEHARALLDRVDHMPPELLDRLHGTIRYLRQVTGETETPSADPMVPDAPWWDPGADASVDPEHDSVIIDGIAVTKGSRVRLEPRLSGTDAQDMFLNGMLATVAAVLSDVDGSTHVAVTVDGDPGAELQVAQGRFRYFDPTEVRPIVTARLRPDLANDQQERLSEESG